MVRSAVLCLQQCQWIAPILQDALRHIYQRSLLEAHGELLQLVEQVWGALMQAVPPVYLVAAATPWLGVWLCLLMQPAKMPYDAAYLIEAKHRVKVSPTSPALKSEPHHAFRDAILLCSSNHSMWHVLRFFCPWAESTS